MQPERTTGIILRVYPLTESSLIVHWLTPDLGRIATVAKGARRPKSPFRGKLDLFFTADFSFVRSRRSELHNLREVNLVVSHEALRKELPCLQQAAYCAALLAQATETETPLPRLYELMSQLLEYLGQEPTQPQTIFAFELQLLEELGLTPSWEKKTVSLGTEKVLAKLARSDWSTIRRLHLSAGQVAEIRQLLHGFLVYHLGKVPETRGPALQVL